MNLKRYFCQIIYTEQYDFLNNLNSSTKYPKL